MQIGGINQINAIKLVLKEFKLNIPVFGLVKTEKHKTRALLDVRNIEIEVSDDLKLYLTNIQEEVHKLAIEYHRKKRDKDLQKSALDNIKGIGDKRKQDLFKAFKTIDNMKNASIEELMRVKGITKKQAEKIKKL